MTRRDLRRLRTQSRFERVRAGFISRATALVRDELSILWIALLAGLCLFQPWYDGFQVLSTSDESSALIGAMWQVQGAALGLSLAVVLFVFQSVFNRLGGSLRDFAEETWLFPIFYAGLVGLVLDGVVLLGGGHGAPGGMGCDMGRSVGRRHRGFIGVPLCTHDPRS